MSLKKPTVCCKASVLAWIKGKDYFMCPCGQTRVNDNGRIVGTKNFNFRRSGRPKKKKDTQALPKVREGVETDFTGLPMDPFSPESWE